MNNGQLLIVGFCFGPIPGEEGYQERAVMWRSADRGKTWGPREERLDVRGREFSPMVMADGTPKVIEFNCRMGDPETQPIMARLKSDLVAICKATLDGTLAEQTAVWDTRASLGVVMAAGGYPESYAKGKAINGLEEVVGESQKVFHAGTGDSAGTVVTSGGRVLCAVGLGEDVAAAATQAYNAVEKIHWDDVYYRRDIGHRAIARERRAE